LPEGREAGRRPDGKGGHSVTLPRAMLDRLKSLRGPGESLQRRDCAPCRVVTESARNGKVSRPWLAAWTALMTRSTTPLSLTQKP
jgi:hypothetical protein